MAHNSLWPYRLPAEWEPQGAVQLTWPHAHTDWAPCLDAITRTFLEMARAIARREHLLIVTPDAAATAAELEGALTAAELERVSLAQMPTDDTWARDHGAITLVRSDEDAKGAAPCQLLDFGFNGWGEKFPADNDNAINARLYALGVFCGAMENHRDFILEGGSIECDGRGTVMTTAHCLLAAHRNKPLTRRQIEERLKTYLNCDRIVWLEHGYLIGDDTDGHIDTLVRMCPDDTLVYQGCDDPADAHYGELQAMARELQALRTLDGHPYRLLRLPLPAALYDDAHHRQPATYANFVILNQCVLVPTYGQPDRDNEAQAVIREAFPGRDIVGIDARTVIQQHGSLHCLTMQYPEAAFPQIR